MSRKRREHFWTTTAEVRQADFFIQIGPRRPKYKRFSSSDSFRIIFQADEIESRSDFKSNCAVIPIVFGTAVAEAVGLNLGLFFCLQLVLMSPKSFLESLVFATAQHSAIRQQGEVVAGILIQLFFVSRLAFSFLMCASSSSCSAHPCRYRQIISKVRFVGWLPV